MRSAALPRTSPAVVYTEPPQEAHSREAPWKWQIAVLVVIGASALGLYQWPARETLLVWKSGTCGGVESGERKWDVLQCSRENVRLVLVKSAGNADEALRRQERSEIVEKLPSRLGGQVTLVYFSDEAESRLLRPEGRAWESHYE